MVPYYLLLTWFLLTCCIFNSFEKNDRKLLQFFSCFVPATCVAMFRDISVGTDTPQYVNAVSLMKTMGYQKYIESGLYAGYEPGFKLLMYICTQFQDPVRTLIMLSSLISIIIPFYVIYRIADNPSISYVLYYLSTMYYFNLNGMRQSLAIAFLFMSILAVYRQKRIMPFAWCIVAVLFHTTALIFLPVLLLARVKPNFSLLFWIPLGAVAIMVSGRFLPRLFSIIPKYNGYVSTGNQYLVSGRFMPLIQIILFGTLLIVFMARKKTDVLPENTDIFQRGGYFLLINMSTYACALMILIGACSLYVNVFYRLMYEMWSVIILAVPLLSRSDKTKRAPSVRSVVAYAAIIVFCVAFIFVPATWFGIDPYMLYSYHYAV